jgi:pentatricopeptide repeat protein
MLRALKRRGLVADVVTWSTVLSALLKTGRTDVGETLLQLMRQHGIEPNVVTYGTIIDHLVRTPDEKYLEAAFQVLRRMEEDHFVQPNLVTYTTFLSGIYARRWINQHAADECANYISQQLTRRRIALDRPAYNTLLQASLDNESQEGLSKALNLYREMVARGVVLGNDTWYILLDGLSRRDEWDIAGELVRCIDKSPGFPMSPGLRGLVEAVRTRTEHQFNRQRGVS